MKNKRTPAVFLDRDGTILNERGYLAKVEDMRFYAGVFPALRRLNQRGFRLVLVTNQSGVARGYFSLADLKKINAAFTKILRRHGVKLAGIYFCPHFPTAGCACRKPKAYLAKKAARDLRLDLKNSYVVGDQLRDLQLSRRIGARGVLVLTGAGRSNRKAAKKIAAKIAGNLILARRWIVYDHRLKNFRGENSRRKNSAK